MQAVHVLVDLENNQPTLDDVRRMVPDVTDVWLFHSPGQKKHLASFAPMGDRQTPVPITRKGGNALDFHLTFYLGYLAAKNPGSKLVVVAIDKGYAPMVEHAAAVLDFEVAQLAFRAGDKQDTGARPKQDKPMAKKKAPATKKIAAKKTAGKRAAKTAAKPVAVAKTKTPPPPAGKKVAAKNGRTVDAAAKKVAVGAPNGPAAAASAATKAVTKKVAAKGVTSAATPRVPKATAKASPPDAPAAAKVAAIAQPPTPEVKQARTLTVPAVVQHLRTMREQRPKKLRQLERHLASLLRTGPADPAVHSLLEGLLAAGVVSSGDGGLTYGTAVTSSAS